MDMNDRLSKLNDYPRKVERIREAYCKNIIMKLGQIEPVLSEFMQFIKTVSNMPNNGNFVNILRDFDVVFLREQNNIAIMLNDAYVIAEGGKVVRSSSNHIDMNKSLVNDVMKLAANNQMILSATLEKIDSIIDSISVIYEKTDAILDNIDIEYDKLCVDDKNFADMFSADNVAKYADEENTSDEELYNEADAPDIIKMRITIDRIPDLKNSKAKSHYEIFFKNIDIASGENVNLTFMIAAGKCIKISDNYVDVILERDDHYSVYMIHNNGKSSKKVFTGWELYKLNREYINSFK